MPDRDAAAGKRLEIRAKLCFTSDFQIIYNAPQSGIGFWLETAADL